MTSTPRSADAPSGAAAAGPPAANGAGPFILTLCRLAAPLSIPPPHAAHLKQFRFFMSRTREPDGGERFHLHMGYFATLSEAQQWADRMRGTYPGAVASVAPAAVLRQLTSGVPTLPAAEPPPLPDTLPPIPFEVDSLTDTQVLTVLETRHLGGDKNHGDTNANKISLLRPDDTNTRRALKEAVVRRAPVSFAVQLQWSLQPIDLKAIPSVSIFRAYSLYTTEDKRDGRCWYCLRLGFFTDAISAKQVAYFVRSSFESVAVVPITEDERTHGTGNRIDLSVLARPAQDPDSLRQRLNEALDKDREESASGSPSRPRKKDSLEQTLELLAVSEMWNDPDSHTETGVRHLKVDVRKHR